MQTKFQSLVFLLLFIALFASCKKKYDSPPQRDIPIGKLLTIEDIRNMFTGTSYKFTDDYSCYAVVTADEKNGNLYKNVFVQDATGAINLRLLTSGGLYQGDSVRIYLKNVVLSKYNGMLQLDSVNADKNIIKQKAGVNVIPKTVTIDELGSALQSHLIKIENVEFVSGDLGKTYADAINQSSQNRTLTDCQNNQVIVRSSGYSNFANQLLPEGNGSIIAIVGEYNGGLQLYIRNIQEVQLTGTRCSGGGGGCSPVQSVNEDFSTTSHDVDIAIACWKNLSVTGNRVWRGREFSGTRYAMATAFNSPDASNECWLVSPPVQTNGNDTLSFESAQAFFAHNGLSVWVSTNFDGSNIQSATWTAISATLAGSASGNYVWVPSGDIPLIGYLPQGYTGAYVVGFKYTGSASGQGTNYCIDNVKIRK